MATKPDNIDIHDILGVQLKTRPGTDLFAKEVLRNKEIKDIIVRYVYGKDVEGSLFDYGLTETLDGLRMDMVYVPIDRSQTLAPIIVEVQAIIDSKFITRLIKYSLATYANYKKYPHTITISHGGFMNQTFKDHHFTREDGWYTHSCMSWADTCRFFTPEFIQKEIQTLPLEKFTALCMVFLKRECNMLLLKYYNDETIQCIYKILTKTKDRKVSLFNNLNNRAINFCDAVLQKMEQIQNQPDPNKKRKLELDTKGLITNFKKKCLEADTATVTSARSLPK